jgi:hypothetical protein
MEKEYAGSKGTEYAIGILETIQILIETQNQDLLNHNLDHIRKIIPLALEELKCEFNQHE